MCVPLLSPLHNDYPNAAQFQSWSFNIDRPYFPGWLPKMGCFEKCTDVEEWGGRNFLCGKVEVRGSGDEGLNPCNFVVTTNYALFKLSTSGFDLLYWC